MDKDTTRLVAELASSMIKDIIGLVREQVYAGPQRGVLTKLEARTAINTPAKRLAAAEAMGVDELISAAKGLEE